jgi:hypothetical protein
MGRSPAVAVPGGPVTLAYRGALSACLRIRPPIPTPRRWRSRIHPGHRWPPRDQQRQRGLRRAARWICQHSPGFRLAVSIEGSRSYDVGPARPIAAAGLVVIHCEQPTRKQRRGKGKSDTIDAHLAVVTALQLDVNRLPTPRADGDREALRIAQRPPRAHDRHHRADQSTTRPLSGDDDAGRQDLPQCAHRGHPGQPDPAPRATRRRPRARAPSHHRRSAFPGQEKSGIS